MSKLLLMVALLVALSVAAVAIGAPFLLPQWAYDHLYGWRYPRSWTCGSATITDSGPATATHRYMVYLGPLPSQPSVQRFTICELPTESMVPGIMVPIESHPWKKEWQVATETYLGIEMRESGSMMGSHHGRLGGDWTWSGPYGQSAFLYSLSLAFDADRGRRYELVLNLESAPPPELSGAGILIAGGGWK
jgi:hypothetical protein